MKLRVGSFNILNTSCRYAERLLLIQSTISEMNCDVLGLQEVSFEGNSEVIANEKYNFSMVRLPFPMIKSDPEFRIDGNGVLIRKNIEILDTHHLTYSTDSMRVAQILTLKKDNVEFILANTHLDHISDKTREIQLRELLNFLNQFQDRPIICTGDYNFTPDSVPYAIMSQNFQSSHLVHNKKEPEITFPTGLIGKNSDIDEYGCFDYIWYKGNTKVENSKVFLNCGNKSLWASDHYPIFSDFIFS